MTWVSLLLNDQDTVNIIKLRDSKLDTSVVVFCFQKALKLTKVHLAFLKNFRGYTPDPKERERNGRDRRERWKKGNGEVNVLPILNTNPRSC